MNFICVWESFIEWKRSEWSEEIRLLVPISDLLHAPMARQNSGERGKKGTSYWDSETVQVRVARSSAFCGKLPLFDSFSAFFPQFRFFPLFEKFLIHSQLTVFKKQFAMKESLLVRVWPLVCKVCKIIGKRSMWRFFYVQAKKARLISHEYCRVISFSAFFSVFYSVLFRFFPLFFTEFSVFMLEHLATLVMILTMEPP